MNNDNITIVVSCEVFNKESELRLVIDFFDTRFFGHASNINCYSKDFIRLTWNRINWMEIFRWWYQRYETQSIGQGITYTFNRFMKLIDPEGEFYKND